MMCSIFALHDYDKSIYFDLQELWFVSDKSDSTTVFIFPDLFAIWRIVHYTCTYGLQQF